MRRIVAFLFALFSTAAVAQYGRMDFQLQSSMGQAISGGNITIYTQTACGTPTTSSSNLSTLYANFAGTATLSNPLTTNGYGMAYAYVDNASCYTVVYYSKFTGTQVYSDQNSLMSARFSDYLPLTGGTLTGALSGTSISMSGNITSGSRFLAAEGTASTGGYSFTAETGQDTGMFSPSDGILSFYDNGALALQFNTSTSPIFPGLNSAGYVTNTSGGILGTVATIPNAGLTYSSTTVNGVTCTLGSTCIVSTGITAAYSQTNVSSPTAPQGTSYTMQGLAASITPAVTGVVDITVSGYINCGTITTAGMGISGIIVYGTGTAPSNGASFTGTGVTDGFEYTIPSTATSGNVNVPFSTTYIVTGLTVSTAYWIDISAYHVGSSVGCKLLSVNVTAIELH